MKYRQIIGALACIALFANCETTSSAGKGNQEVKRMAAEERQRQESQEVDEAHRNLWNAQHDILTRDGNAASHYY